MNPASPTPAMTSTSSAAFASFQAFLGDVQPTMSPELDAIMNEIEARGIRWVTTLQEYEDKIQDPAMVRGKTVLALGPLEGGLEWHIARLGAKRIVSVEGYELNYLKCQALRAAFPEAPLEFILSDVNTFDVSETFDLVVCFGLLYHLAQPQQLLQKLSDIRPKQVFIATQLAVDDPHPAAYYWRLGDAATIEHNGRTYRGRWYPEMRIHDLDYRSGLKDGEDSFWFYPAELTRLAEDLGFRVDLAAEHDLGEMGVIGGWLLSMPER